MRILLGIDDTDNLESRGTGFLVRTLANELEEVGLADIEMITRHQLLVHESIPYTSHNSSAAICLESGDIEGLKIFSMEFLDHMVAEGSDAGLCVIPWDAVPKEITQWGNRAKREVLLLEDAFKLSEKFRFYLKGLSGDHGGVIGAIAAVGLRKEGNDGRVLWMPGLRELRGILTAEELMQKNKIGVVSTIQGDFIPLHSKIWMGDWVRPVMSGSLSVLFVEATNDEHFQYRVAAKEYIKGLSE